MASLPLSVLNSKLFTAGHDQCSRWHGFVSTQCEKTSPPSPPSFCLATSLIHEVICSVFWAIPNLHPSHHYSLLWWAREKQYPVIFSSFLIDWLPRSNGWNSSCFNHTKVPASLNFIFFSSHCFLVPGRTSLLWLKTGLIKLSPCWRWPHGSRLHVFVPTTSFLQGCCWWLKLVN